MRVLALDLGSRRIGLALSDPEGRLAFPEGALQRRDPQRDVEALCELCRERGVERVVVGLPLHLHGGESEGARQARRFAAALAEATGVPVDTLDERWTTREAQRSLDEAGPRSRKRRRRSREHGTVDAVAAALLLRTYLERRTSLAAAAEAERP